MEDAAIHEVNLGDGNSLFAVFDGHGGNSLFILGHEVSKYVESRFVQLLLSLNNYKDKKYTMALDEAFRLMDEQIMSD